MKFKILCLILIIIVFLLPLICFSEPDTKAWEKYGEDGRGDISYYDKTNITKSSDTISVWTYTIVANDVREKTIKIEQEEDSGQSVKYQNLDHIIMLSEIDCQYKVWRLEEIIFYDDTENVLDEQRNNFSDWADIIPISLMGRLYNKVCLTTQRERSEKKSLKEKKLKKKLIKNEGNRYEKD